MARASKSHDNLNLQKELNERDYIVEGAPEGGYLGQKIATYNFIIAEKRQKGIQIPDNSLDYQNINSGIQEFRKAMAAMFETNSKKAPKLISHFNRTLEKMDEYYQLRTKQSFLQHLRDRYPDCKTTVSNSSGKSEKAYDYARMFVRQYSNGKHVMSDQEVVDFAVGYNYVLAQKQKELEKRLPYWCKQFKSGVETAIQANILPAQVQGKFSEKFNEQKIKCDVKVSDPYTEMQHYMFTRNVRGYHHDAVNNKQGDERGMIFIDMFDIDSPELMEHAFYHETMHHIQGKEGSNWNYIGNLFGVGIMEAITEQLTSRIFTNKQGISYHKTVTEMQNTGGYEESQGYLELVQLLKDMVNNKTNKHGNELYKNLLDLYFADKGDFKTPADLRAKENKIISLLPDEKSKNQAIKNRENGRRIM
jgi:hypothetical protein